MALKDDECCICYEKIEHAYMYPCRHITCEPCAHLWFKRSKSCPICRTLCPYPNGVTYRVRSFDQVEFTGNYRDFLSNVQGLFAACRPRIRHAWVTRLFAPAQRFYTCISTHKLKLLCSSRRPQMPNVEIRYSDVQFVAQLHRRVMIIAPNIGTFIIATASVGRAQRVAEEIKIRCEAAIA